ncbi:vitamin B12 ABC transporter ATP-binding protein BtuD [Candidatus Pantoea deserta]|uniref:Vitamin B12 import ATP-binding protein BtuD n=1 Tax=Candidatus Pantoea deserta TaxID=1869313 RepID=A0A3N4PFS5_9GAMM|nr:vitamin B12 ABC transporter ATP-binding protein BtuD [Pantoea deserta]RPD98383.1 vitamin B12 ABC transporter ATP-binding protein BtuD [Pantoea deserta]
MVISLKDAAVAGRLASFSASVAAGTLLHLVGPNGAGKSSLLALMAGMLAGEGEIRLLDRPLHKWRGQALARVRAWLPQQMPPGLMPVYHYLRLHLNDSASDGRLTALLERLQLLHKLTQPLSQLSGGEWQRVRLAAVIAQIDPALNPQGKMLILDEPMTGLDIAQQHAVQSLIVDLCQAGVCVIASSHDLNHTLCHADSVWLMAQGRVLAQGDAAAVLTPSRLSEVYAIPFRQLELDGRPLLMAQP